MLVGQIWTTEALSDLPNKWALPALHQLLSANELQKDVSEEAVVLGEPNYAGHPFSSVASTKSPPLKGWPM